MILCGAQEKAILTIEGHGLENTFSYCDKVLSLTPWVLRFLADFC